MIRCVALAILLLAGSSVCSGSDKDRSDREVAKDSEFLSADADDSQEEIQTNAAHFTVTGALQPQGNASESNQSGDDAGQNKTSLKRKVVFATAPTIRQDEERKSDQKMPRANRRRTRKFSPASDITYGEEKHSVFGCAFEHPMDTQGGMHAKASASTAKKQRNDSAYGEIVYFTTRDMSVNADTQESKFAPDVTTDFDDLVTDMALYSYMYSMYPPGRQTKGMFGIVGYEYMLDVSEQQRQMRLAILNHDHDAIRAIATQDGYSISEPDFILAALSRGPLAHKPFVKDFCLSATFGEMMREQWTLGNMDATEGKYVACPALAELAATQLLYPLFNLHSAPMTSSHSATLRLLADLARASGAKISALWLFRYLATANDFESMRILLGLGVVIEETLCNVLDYLVRRQDRRPIFLAAFLRNFAANVRAEIEGMNSTNAMVFKQTLLRAAMARMDETDVKYAVARELVAAGICDSAFVVLMGISSTLNAAAFAAVLDGAPAVSAEAARGILLHLALDERKLSRLLQLAQHKAFLAVICDALAMGSLQMLQDALIAHDSPGYEFAMRIFTELSEDMDFVESVARLLFKPQTSGGETLWDPVGDSLRVIQIYAVLHDSLAECDNTGEAIAAIFDSMRIDKH